MTPAQRAAMRALAKAATPGPWYVVGHPWNLLAFFIELYDRPALLAHLEVAMLAREEQAYEAGARDMRERAAATSFWMPTQTAIRALPLRAEGQRVSDERLAQTIEAAEDYHTSGRSDAFFIESEYGRNICLDLRDARAESARLRAALIEAQEAIDYGTRAGGAAEVLAHIATVLKGDGHATIQKGGDADDVSNVPLLPVRLPLPGNVVTGAAHPNNAEGAGDESWQARRAELLDALPSSDERRDAIAAALDRAFEFGREMRT